MSIALAMFLIFVAVTLVITYWAARRSSGASAYFAASRQITGWQNGIAVAGDYMSAASFLGIAGIIAFQGYDGFMYSVGFLVAYLTVLLIVAGVLRAGLVRLAVPAEVLPIIAAANPCYLTASLPQDMNGQLALPAEAELANLVEVGTALLAAAGARKESRGAHTRTDFPATEERLRHRFVIYGSTP